MTLIYIIIVAMYLILIAWTWQSLGNIEKRKKVAYIILGILLFFIITLIIFNISKSNVEYQKETIKNAVRNLLVLLFTAVNGIIFIPYVARILNKVEENEIEKEKLKIKAIVFIIIFVICVIIECGYLENIQNGIISIYNSKAMT